MYCGGDELNYGISPQRHECDNTNVTVLIIGGTVAEVEGRRGIYYLIP